MSEMKKENPTVKVVISMKLSEKNEFFEFSKKSNIPFSAICRMGVKKFIKTDGAKYIND